MLCSKVTESEVQHFISCIEKSRNVKYLRFLQTVVKGGSRRAQEMIMNEVGGCGLGWWVWLGNGPFIRLAGSKFKWIQLSM